jgi:hypothetical protein
MIRILSQMLVGTLFTVLAGFAAAQLYRGGYLLDVADTKAVPTQAGGDTTSPPASAQGTSATKSKASTSHAASKSSSHHAHVKSASHKKSTSHTATTHAASTHHAKSTNKSTKASAEPPVAPEESAYRQALRGCATQQDQAQRDSCLNSAIEKHRRNT